MFLKTVLAGLLTAILFVALGSGTICDAQSADPEPKHPFIQAMQRQIQDLETKKDALQETSLLLDKSLIELKAERKKLFQKHDELGVSSAAFPDIVKTLQIQKVQMSIDIAGLDARRSFLTETAERVEAERDDDVLAPLKSILELEQNAFEVAKEQVDNGIAPLTVLQDAERRVLLAKIRLAEGKKSFSSVTSIQADLLDSSLQRAEKQARMDRIESILNSLTSSREEFETAAMSGERIELVTASREQILADIQQAEIQLDRLNADFERLNAQVKDDQ